MPALVFTVNEVAHSLVDQQRRLAREIRDLADLVTTPLYPGESVADRHHKIAKLGKQLADAFTTFDSVMSAVIGEEPKPGVPASDNTN